MYYKSPEGPVRVPVVKMQSSFDDTKPMPYDDRMLYEKPWFWVMVVVLILSWLGYCMYKNKSKY